MKSRAFLYVSLLVDILITISKFIVAAITRSSSMISEGVHSLIDTTSQLLLIWGVKKSKRKPDENRPFGYGKEFYFWSFVVSLVIFLLGGCISVYEGFVRFHNPEFQGNPNWSYLVLGIAFAFNTVSMFSALKAFNKQRGDVSFFRAVIDSKDPSTFIVLLGDIGDLLGLTVAFFGVYLGRRFHDPTYDGIAAIIIGVILIFISALLVRESKSLLMGETTTKTTRRRIISITEADNAIIKVKRQSSMYMAPEEILLQLFAVFKKELTTDQITDAIERISGAIQKEFPRITQIFIEPVK